MEETPPSLPVGVLPGEPIRETVYISPLGLDVSVDEEQGVSHRIAWWLENALIRVFKRFWNAIADKIHTLYVISLGRWVDNIEAGLITVINPFLQKILDTPELPDYVREPVRRAKSGEHQGGVIVLGALAVGMAHGIASAITGPFVLLVSKPFHRLFRGNLPDIASLMMMRLRNPLSEHWLIQAAKSLGYTDFHIARFIELSRQYLEQDELTSLLWRNKLEPGQVRDILQKQGYTPEDAQLWLDTRKLIPTPADLISIATREGFDDEVARHFGYDENYPSDAGEWAEKGGLRQEWFKRFWRAHWRLPGVREGFEMFQRRAISEEELKLLLRASDIPSFWREALLEISYTRITRVDVRRMYNLNLLEPAEVYISYKDLGYSPDDAMKMTQWTIAQYSDKERELTKADILGMYKDGTLNEGETDTYLTALGYRDDDVALLIARIDLQRQSEYEKEVKENVRLLYLAGLLDRGDVFQQLSALEPPSGFVENALAVWDLEKRRRVRVPTVVNLRNFWLADAISEGELREELGNLGFADKYVGYFMSYWLARYGTAEET